ncbi:hypothetical protein SY83_19635 [Paenibacillus swuensis]|uniref:AB hydrolase-1 domain-containing protein n=1 Tax=Paenibacillus swuensis TaxID=1178515 RepID=A0A172TPS2_9BACL|nr:hypothetical protein SY83_19635 [Paenibacillus swuensis]
MQFKDHFINNRGVTIHCIESVPTTDEIQTNLSPLLISPGLSMRAEEYKDLMEQLSPRRCIALSFRGRGLSDTPAQGYALEHHISDIVAVTKHLQLENFHLMAYSRGVSYALGYALRNRPPLRSIILQDYPAAHKQMSEEWAEDYIHNYLIPHHRIECIRVEAVHGIQRESQEVEFWEELHSIDVPVLVLRGATEEALIQDEHEQQYSKHLTNGKVVTFHRSGHDLHNTERDKFIHTLQAFLHAH